MTTRFASLIGLSIALFVGCSNSAPPQRAEPVDVEGVVQLPNEQPLKDVTVNFLPTSPSQVQVGTALKSDGKFAVQLIPGKYTYSIEGSAAALKKVPTKYLSNDPVHTFEVPSGGNPNLTIKLTN